MNENRRVLAVFLAIALLAGTLSPQIARADETDVLDFCLEQPKACAISVHAIDEGWERHSNADRPQVLASTFKILVLLAYAQAVADGDVSPDDTVDKDEWARYYSGGSTLDTSWDLMGNPNRPRLDDLARVLILNSDNSAPDFFLAMLKKKLIKGATKHFDWHDSPVGISAMFGLWQNLNGVGGTGNRVAGDYGGFEAVGFQKELAKHTKNLKKDSFVQIVRRSMCQQPPWEGGVPPCNQPRPFTTEESFRILENHHFTRSTTRAYASLMRELLERTLLSSAAQDVVERHLDDTWFDQFPSLSPAFSRYGLKGGNLGTGAGNQVLTWAHYMQTPAGRYVVVVFLQDMLKSTNPPESVDVNAFAQQFALNAGFRQQVRNAFSAAPLRVELAPQLKKVSQKGKSLTMKVKVLNTSPVKANKKSEVTLYLLDDTEIGGATAIKTVRVGKISAYKSKTATFKVTADSDLSGKFAVIMIDSGDDIREQDEANNLTWQKL